MLDKKRICYLLRKNYPETFGIRIFLQGMKVKRARRYLLTNDEIRKGEEDPSSKESISNLYLKKWEKYLKSAVIEMEDILNNAPEYKERQDIDKIRTDMIFCRLAYGFIPSEYVCFELEEKTPEQRKEYVSDVDMNVFGYSVNNIVKVQSVLDKCDCYLQFSDYYKRDAIVVSKKSDYSAFSEFVEKHPIFVKKKAFSGMGKGTWLVDMTREHVDKRNYFHQMIAAGKHLLEEKVIQREEMARFNASSVNTVRCITLKTKEEVIVPWCFMRTGRKDSFVDNGGSGGLVIGVDAKTGVINTDGYDEYNERYVSHPDSGVTFIGTQIPEWDALLTFCKNAAAKVKDMGYMSWDLAYTEKGWVVIEINEVGQFIGPQMTTKKGIKRELWSYLDNMKMCI